VLAALVLVRPLALMPLIGAAAVMCGLHGLLVAATGALFMIPDLLDYGAAVAFALWGVAGRHTAPADGDAARVRPSPAAGVGAPSAAQRRAGGSDAAPGSRRRR